VRLADEDVLGFEALLHWNHPDGTVRLPGQFLAQLEETGLISGLEVVAEGVEKTEQRDFFRDLGCDYAQGWWFGRPEPRR